MGDGFAAVADFAVAQGDGFAVPFGGGFQGGAHGGVADGKLAETGEETGCEGEIVIGEGAEIGGEMSELFVAGTGGGDAFSGQGERIHQAAAWRAL